MKMPESVILAKTNLRTNVWKIKKNFKVRDHCHYSGGYRDAAHNICNLRYSAPKKIL